jgi:hypothetical protein
MRNLIPIFLCLFVAACGVAQAGDGVISISRGELENASYGANASVDTHVYSPPLGGARGVTFYLLPTRAVSVQLLEQNSAGAFVAYAAAVAIAANTPWTIEVERPIGHSRLRITNTDNNTGTCRVDVAENR